MIDGEDPVVSSTSQVVRTDGEDPVLFAEYEAICSTPRYTIIDVAVCQLPGQMTP